MRIPFGGSCPAGSVSFVTFCTLPPDASWKQIFVSPLRESVLPSASLTFNFVMVRRGRTLIHLFVLCPAILPALNLLHDLLGRLPPDLNLDFKFDLCWILIPHARSLSGFYIYTKAAAQDSGEQARLDAVKATAPPTGACVRFWYHMHGSRMGKLTVYTGDEKGGLGPSRWSKKGDSGDYWQEASINIYPGSEFQITFVGECRASYGNDIAIDDIVVLERQCSSYASFSDLKCDFDSKSFCAYNNSQNDDFDWILNRGSTYTGVSGPDVDHSKGDSTGFYIYIKAMLQNPGDQARLDAVKATAPATGACVKFWYHMYGSGMGTLMVYTGDGKGGLGPSRWSKSGDSGNVWHEASINIGYGLDFQISFVGECGRNAGSEIAVDDIIVLEGQCNNKATFSDLECNFDFNAFCAYKNHPYNEFDWHLHSGPISGPDTGPEADRTTGDPSGFFIYSKVSRYMQGDQARLDGVKATAPATGACVRFWYYMYGGDEGTLTVYTGDGSGGLGPSRWSRKGDSGDYWHEAWINIYPGSDFQITFVGEGSWGYSCDVAIDDIIVLERECDSTVPLSDLNCDFEPGTFCAYKNSQNDDFDWILNSVV
ncbi:MAM and LDL-receptor class A domain-containing protein 1-like [Acanthaster planci]|uniref:MAM and LDL-receptor class A domain-containing protein 1-like n=1 Tax=Acanthaster planci TaxID=133434 RepID=A0A8B8A4L6_ACAPL|nr:MAM and LDL-receptor class A domain-containing protein 1-like [Acanthaster planci]